MRKKVLIGVLSLLSAVCCGLAVSGCVTPDGSEGGNPPDSNLSSDNENPNGSSGGNKTPNTGEGDNGGQTPATDKGYKITVYGSDGKPFEGAEVSINNTSALTGKDGTAEFADMVRGAYGIEVYADGHTVTKPQTTGNQGELSVYLSKVADNKVFTVSEFGTVRYAVEIGWEPDPERQDMINPKNEVYTVKNTGTAAALFTITLKDAVAYSAFEYAPRHSVGTFNSAGPSDEAYSPVSVVLEQNETFTFTLTADYTAFDSQDKASYPVVYDVDVTSGEAPEKGSSKLYMYDALPDGQTSVKITPDSPAYFKFDSTAAEYKGADFRFTFDDEDTVIEDFGTLAGSVSGSRLSNGAAIAGYDYYARVLRVTSKSGNVSFTVNKEVPSGTQNNPIRLFASDSGNTYEGETSNTDRLRTKWYTITNDTAEAKTYTIVPDEEKGAKMTAYVYGENDAIVSYSVEGKSLWFEVPAGETYKIAVGNSDSAGEYAFLFRDYNPATDIGGDNVNNPITYVVKEGEQSYSVSMDADSSSKYFMFETAVAGYYTVTVESEAEGATQIIADRFTVENPREDKVANHAIDDKLDGNKLFTDKISVCITMTNFKAVDTVWNIHINFTPLDAVDNTVTVSGDTVAGLTVNIKKDGRLIASGTTGSDGVARISFIPGVYDIELTGFDSSLYGYNPAKTQFLRDGGNFEIKLASLGAYAFTVKNPDGSLASGATVTVKNGETVLAEGNTDADGKFTTDIIVLGEYEVSVAVTGNSYLKPVKTSAGQTDMELNLSEPAQITHASDTSVPALEEGRSIVKNATTRSGRYNYSFTAQSAGTYMFTITSTTDLYGIYKVYLTENGTTLGTEILSNGTLNDEGNILGLNDGDKKANGTYTYYTKVDIKLEEGQSIIVAIYNNTTNTATTVDITKN